MQAVLADSLRMPSSETYAATNDCDIGNPSSLNLFYYSESRTPASYPERA